MKRTLLVIVFCQIFLFRLSSQGTFPSNGAPYNPHTLYAFTNATIFVDFETVIKSGTLLIKDGKVVSAGPNLSVPKHAVVVDLKGKFIYPAFIDLYSNYGLASVNYERKHMRGPQMESNQNGAYGWNMAIRSNIHANERFQHHNDNADELRKLGFAAVLSSPLDGIVRGSGVLALLNSSKKENESIIKDKAAAFYSFVKGSSPQDYPSSLTGAIALLRQTYYDAQWYRSNLNKTEYNISLEEFNKLQSLPSIFEGNDKYNDLRAVKISQEFGISYIIKAGGNEYQRIHDIKKTGAKYILPVNFPEPYDVEDPFEAENISLSDLKHWELAPTNPSAFEKNNIAFAFTTADLKDKSLFLKNLRKAVQYGLSEATALKALTANPAAFINVSDKLGALKPGYFANFFISNKSIFDADALIFESWVNGVKKSFADLNAPDLRGIYNLSVGKNNYNVTFSGEAVNSKAEIKVDTTKKSFNYNFAENNISFNFSVDSTNKIVRANGNYDPLNKSFSGKAQLHDGNWIDFTMVYTTNSVSSKKDSLTKKELPSLGKIIYPFTAYGQALPDENAAFTDAWSKFKNRYSAILIKNATVWTNEADSILTDHDVYVVEGKIVRIAPNIDAPNLAFAKVIDAKGKHLTAGIIDEHSHIALTSGVNEAGEASSAEVRMGDVINPEDINIYRQLSGGVTTSQLLHGSANPIGGQSALIKLRWGQNAEEMKFENADGFIKFALGENVKQSNWGDHNTVRFPQSRMGVEQVYYDFFTRAKEYDQKVKSSSSSKTTTTTVRRDLELDALAEILNNKRFITCHSYVQSEINMLMHVADSFQFKVNTFTHILEGYKVADKMKLHGVCASTFSDWWAYKNEVKEAIPYNAAILTRVGVVTAINSDDAEMARRLNQEAAKSVKYGALTEVEALKLVTLNPAKMLHIDSKVGSIKVGKVADLVLWTDNPLSVYAKADKTIIDGQIYFDRDEDLKLRAYVRDERARIIAKLLLEKQKGNRVQKAPVKTQQLYHCNTIEGVAETETGHR